MPFNVGNFVEGAGIFYIHDRGFKDMVADIAGFQLQDVKQFVGIQACFFTQLSDSGIGHGFSGLDLAARKRPFRTLLTHEENFPVLCANNCRSVFHICTSPAGFGQRLHLKCARVDGSHL